jgi:hypothetical protein
VSIQPEEFLAQSPSAFLNQPSFLETGPQAVDAPVDTHPDYLKIGIGIAAALVVLRLLMKHEFSKEDLLTDKEIAEAAARIYKRVIPAWLQASVPAVLQAYRLGATQQLTYEEMTRLATSYASELGDYVHGTSTQALLEGFNAQVNSGWSANLAWQRSREAYGLDARQMQSYVQGLTKLDKTEYVTDPIPVASRMFVDRAFLYRADRLGTTEAYKASRVGKNMVWMIMEGTGQLPPGTMKKWITAEDELVCGVCGPLHGVTIPLNERFETIGGERFYAPVVHPNCRCDLELVYPDLGTDVVKAMGKDPFDRNADGEFAATESRKATKVTRVNARTTVRTKAREGQQVADAAVLGALADASVLDSIGAADASVLSTMVDTKQQVADASVLNALVGEKKQALTIVQHHDRPNLGGEGVHHTDAWMAVPDVLATRLDIDANDPPSEGEIVDFSVIQKDPSSVHGVEGFAVLHAEDNFVDDLADHPAFTSAYDAAMAADEVDLLRNQIGADGMGVTISSYAEIDGAIDIYTDPEVGAAAEAFSGKEKTYLTHLAARTLTADSARAAASEELTNPHWIKSASASEIAIEMTAAVNNERENNLGELWQDAARQARQYGSYDPEDVSISRYGMDEGSTRAIVPILFRFKNGWWGTDEGPVDLSPYAPNKSVIEGKYKVTRHEYVPSPDGDPAVRSVLIIDLELLDAP